MIQKYNPNSIERKWQKKWEQWGLYQTKDDSIKPKKYILVEFPYPSGNLHVGHWYAFSVPDIYARAKRMQGYNVLYPIGFDAFGLPAENAAIKRHLNPQKWTYDNMDYMRRQIRSMGTSFDMSREVITCDPKYYRWTQWLFLQLFKKGLAVQKETEVNWCPSCKTVLANEQVIQGYCERCDSEVEQKKMKQWNILITQYADRLIDDLDDLEWADAIKEQQKNWIGRSEGVTIRFSIVKNTMTGADDRTPNDEKDDIEVFTTRVDTVFGVTYIVVAPEHKLLQDARFPIQNRAEIDDYVKAAQKKSNLERTELEKMKTGVKIEGIQVINPFSGERVPVYVADYVLGSYGTGAVMAVPAHDERDFDFAQKYELPMKQSIAPYFTEPQGRDAVRPDKETVRRRAVFSLVKHWQEDKYICLDWEKFGWHSGIIGGVEEGEDVIQAACREITEETGYKKPKFAKFLGGEMHANFFAAHKDINRYAEGVGMLFELEDDSWSEPDPNETRYHKTIWIDGKDLKNFLNLKNFQYMRSVLESSKDCYTQDGILIQSGDFTGLDSAQAREKMTQWLERTKNGKKSKQYKLRDWTVSRQRYWGVPIPIINCEKCGSVAVPDEQLPVVLPEINDYLPREDGRSPLSKATEWSGTLCPKCALPAERETDTLDTFVCSSWYFLRYTNPDNDVEFASKEKQDLWMPVDLYSGGAEHVTMHLLYSRFFYKALFDLGLVSQKEPYARRMNRGLILGPDGNKMSKSKGNVIDPDDVIREFGADSMRLYLAFIGPYNVVGSYPWNTESVSGVRRFLEKVLRLSRKVSKEEPSFYGKEVEVALQRTIKKVTDSIEEFKFNTAISQMMIFSNLLEKEEFVSRALFSQFLILLSPFSPHITEEIWEALGNEKSIFLEQWPVYNETFAKEETMTIIIQVNGKVRDQLIVSCDETQEVVAAKVLLSEKVKKSIGGRKIVKTVYVPGKIFSIVIGQEEI